MRTGGSFMKKVSCGGCHNKLVYMLDTSEI